MKILKQLCMGMAAAGAFCVWLAVLAVVGTCFVLFFVLSLPARLTSARKF